MSKTIRLFLLITVLAAVVMWVMFIYLRIYSPEKYFLTLEKMFGEKIYEIPFVKGHKIDNLIILPAGTEITSYLEYPVLVPMVSEEKQFFGGMILKGPSYDEITQKRKWVDLHSVNVNNVLRCSPQLYLWGDKSVREVFARLYSMSCSLIDKKDLLPDPTVKPIIVVLDGYIKADPGCKFGIKGGIETKGKEEFISLKEGSTISFVLTQPLIVDSLKGENK